MELAYFNILLCRKLYSHGVCFAVKKSVRPLLIMSSLNIKQKYLQYSIADDRSESFLLVYCQNMALQVLFYENENQ